MIGTAAAGGIYAAPTSQPILFILVYGRGRGMPRPYQSIKTKSKTLELPLYYTRNKARMQFFCPAGRGAATCGYRSRLFDSRTPLLIENAKQKKKALPLLK